MNFKELVNQIDLNRLSVKTAFQINRLKMHPNSLPNNAEALLNTAILEAQNFVIPQYNIEYPELPVSQQKDLIIEALQSHQVLILQAETGSGKTTQIPKIALEMGLANHGLIGCTQPRRIAALTIADRIREELKSQDLVSHKIRFIEQSNEKAKIKIMTDGILLQELQRDPLLLEYQCIILDEAHERSLNIDILLGMCKRILKRRSDLKLIITSATLDGDQFKKYFPTAKIIECEGRAFPVDIEYFDPEEIKDEINDGGDFHDWTVLAIEKLWSYSPDHTLVFLPTEKDILELKDRLEELYKDKANVLPLYGRLSASDQKLVFADSLKPKIILSTNVAETSLTLPGIAYVIDSGLSRLSRYNTRQRIQTLPIEYISQANARQRAGRAGRVKAGKCIRLYSQETYESLAEFADPEILRSNLSNVVLQLLNLKVNPQDFDYLKSPDKKDIRGALIHLEDLDAIDSVSKSRLTPIGREIARLPMDVNLARVLLEAKKNNILGPALVINAALCLQDIWAIPSEEPEKSKGRQVQNLLKDPTSDLLTILNIWNEWKSRLEENYSHNKMRKWCNQNYISWMRMRDWTDLINQFSRIIKHKEDIGVYPIDKINSDALHQSFIPGFFHGISLWDKNKNTYKLSGNREAFIFPASTLFKRKPQWLMACDLRETSKLFLNHCLPIKPEWIVKSLSKFCKKTYTHQAYNPETGYVEAMEAISFRGLIVQKGRRIQYQNIDAVASENIFWNDAIGRGQISLKLDFLTHNISELGKIRLLEKKVRTIGLVPTPEKQGEWYISNVQGICSDKSLKRYIKIHGDDKLRFDSETWKNYGTLEDLNIWIKKSSSATWEDLYPDQIKNGPALHYTYDHGNILDGIQLLNPSQKWELLSPSEFALLIVGWQRWVYLFWREQSSAPTVEHIEKHFDEFLSLWQNKLKSGQYSIVHSLYLACHHFLKNTELKFSIPKNFEAYFSLNTPWLDLTPEMGPAMQLAEYRRQFNASPKLIISKTLNAYGVLEKGREYWYSHPLKAMHQWAFFNLENQHFDLNPWFRDAHYKELKNRFDRIFSKVHFSIHSQEAFLAQTLNWLEKNERLPQDVFLNSKVATKANRSLKSLNDLKNWEHSADSQREKSLCLAFLREFQSDKDLGMKIWDLLKKEWDAKPDKDWMAFWSKYKEFKSKDLESEIAQSYLVSLFICNHYDDYDSTYQKGLVENYLNLNTFEWPRLKTLRRETSEWFENLDSNSSEKNTIDQCLNDYEEALKATSDGDFEKIRQSYFTLKLRIEEITLNNLRRGLEYLPESENKDGVSEDKLLALKNAFKGR